MAQQSKVQIKGLLRFSYLSENGFAKSAQGIDRMRDMLYAPDRLARRFALFEGLALHTLRAQTDQDFKIGILIGDDFPSDALARLQTLVKGFASAHLISLPPMVHYQAVKAAFEQIPDDPEATHTATFRQDDDDAIHVETIHQIRAVATQLLSMRASKDPFAIAFNRGFYFDPNVKGMVSEWYERTPLGIGLALVAGKGDPSNVFRRNHRQFSQYYDCYTEVSQPMWIRSVHPDNDSSAAPTGRAGSLRPRAIRKALRDGFGLSHEVLADLTKAEGA